MADPMSGERLLELSATVARFEQYGGVHGDRTKILKGARELLAEVERLRASVEHLKGDVRMQRVRAEKAWDVVREGAENTRAALATVRAERDEARTERAVAREQVERVRARHEPQCGGACATTPCECEPGDLSCAECETPHPCPTVLDLDREEADRA